MAHVTNQNPEYDFHKNKQIEEEKKKYHTKKASNRNGLFDIPTNSKKLNKNATGNAYDFLYFSTLTSFDFQTVHFRFSDFYLCCSTASKRIV